MVLAGVVIGAGPMMISVMVRVMPLRMILLKHREARVFRPVQVNRAGQNSQRLRRSAKLQLDPRIWIECCAALVAEVDCG